MHIKSQSIPELFKDRSKFNLSSPQVISNLKVDEVFAFRGTTGSFLAKSRESKREGSMEQYRGPIGNQAKMEYYESYKKLPAITERNKYNHIENSPNVAYLQEIDKKHLKPLPFGVIRSKGSEKCIDLHGKSMGDNYASALSKSFKNINSVEILNLKNNRLTEKGASALLAELGSQRLRELNLSDNKLGQDSINQVIYLLSKESSVLKVLNLENVSAKEVDLIRLISSIGNNSTLVYLALAKNCLTGFTACALKSALQSNYTLQKLDLHWNNLNPLAGLTVFEALEANKTLQELDISWNSLGGDSKSANFEKICQILANNKTLLHLDLSYNYLTLKEANAFADSIKSNHTLLGIHIEGNYSSVNANGFVEIDSMPKLRESALAFKRIFKVKKKTDNCWICGNWVEFTLKFQIETKPPVYIHFEQDGYEPFLLHFKGEFSVSRVFPEGSQKFYLSVKNRPFILQDYDTAKLKYPQEFKADDRIVPVSVVNCFKVVGEKINLNYPFMTAPRMLMTHVFTDSEERIPWLFENSVFRDYVKDNDALMNSCFELDWSLSKLEGFIRDPQDKSKTKAYLKSIYKTIRLCYKSLSSFAANEIFSIGSNTQTDFLYSCKIFDQVYSVSDFGINWNSANLSTNKGLIFNPGNALVRYEFMEIIVRVANDKFCRPKTVKTIKKALKKLMSENIFPNIEGFECNEITSMNTNWWRDNIYMVEDVDLMLKVYKPVLEHVYARYSGRKTLPGCKKFMSLEEFIDLCKDANLITDDISNREVTFCFVQSMMTQVDEYTKSRHFEMSFIEFLESITRVCDMRDSTPKSLFQKMSDSFPSLLTPCSKFIIDSFEIPTPNTFHKMKFKTIKY